MTKNELISAIKQANDEQVRILAGVVQGQAVVVWGTITTVNGQNVYLLPTGQNVFVWGT